MVIYVKIVDGKNAVLGRLASITARKLLEGEEVSIVNAEGVIITGDPTQIRHKYIARRQRGSPQHGPFFPTEPNTIVRRTVRSMLPYKTAKGRNAFKKLRVYTGVPAGLENEDKEKVANKHVKSDFISVGDVARTLGWRAK